MTLPFLRHAALLLALTMIWSFASGATGALIIIDDFELPLDPTPANGGYLSPGNAGLGQGNPLVAQQNAPVANTIGGQRDVFVQQTDDNVNGGSSVVNGRDDWYGVERGQYVANTAVEDVLYHQLQYDGDGEVEMPDGPLSDAKALMVDLTDNGANDHFLIRFRNSQVPHAAGLGLFFTVTSASGVSTYTGAMSDTGDSGMGVPNVVDLLIPFADFGGTAEFNAVTSLTFNFNGGGVTGRVGADFAIDLIATVPEPSGAALLGLGAVGLAVPTWQRRRRRAG